MDDDLSDRDKVSASILPKNGMWQTLTSPEDCREGDTAGKCRSEALILDVPDYCGVAMRS